MNTKKAYQNRIREGEGGTSVLCNNCSEWLDPDNFYVVGGKFSSFCKTCHKEKYRKSGSYRSPSALKKAEDSRKRRAAFLSEPITCPTCGETKPRREYYQPSQKRYADSCCSFRRTDAQVQADIAEGMKNCGTCGLRLPFSEYQSGGGGRDKVRGSCKCCSAARLKMYSERKDRVDLIKATDDGTASIVAMSKMLRETERCPVCNIVMGQHYPVQLSSKTIDHMVPLSRGGGHTLENITVLCFGCNSAKGNRTMAEFARVKKKAVRQ